MRYIAPPTFQNIIAAMFLKLKIDRRILETKEKYEF